MIKKAIILSAFAIATSTLVGAANLDDLKTQVADVVNDAIDTAYENGFKDGQEEGIVSGIDAEEMVEQDGGHITDPEEVASETVELEQDAEEIEENVQALLDNPEELDKIMQSDEFKKMMSEFENNPELAKQLEELNQDEISESQAS